MTRLSFDKILQEKGTEDPSTITSLVLTHRALSDVSCLAEFKNLERLDLGFNTLSSLEDLKSCVNLKWLSVIQNKLQSLKGIEGLTKLTVLNAGKNQLRSMDEVCSVVSLRALILNDNEITSICPLHQLKELNTLVLSKNPVRDIKKSLEKTKSLTKLSLSHCQLQTLSSSLKSCTELKELRLAHNEITVLPSELANNVKIHTLDLGNNSIINWSDLKVLNSLSNLKNLNLHGNPIADKAKFVIKVKRLIPNLQILNTKPLDKYTHDKQKDVEPSTFSTASEVKKQEKDGDQAKKNKKTKHRKDLDDEHGGAETIEKKSKPKKRKTESKHDGSTLVEKAPEKRSKAVRKVGADVIDDTDTPFTELVVYDLENLEDASDKLGNHPSNAGHATVTYPSKKKKGTSLASGAKALELLATPVDVGMGGPSTWD
uniref:Protein phosphatase 1 regulatory subunit 7 n=1 Tax=Kalanchoe fedtschenkoi TaxID=63787 RepID=A0A7N0UA71_KALFE